MPREFNVRIGALFVKHGEYWYKLGEGIANMHPSITECFKQNDEPDFEVANDEEMLEMLGIKR